MQQLTSTIKVHPLSKIPVYAAVHVFMSKKHQRSSTVQGKGLTNEGRHNLLLLCKQAMTKKSIAESLQAYVTRARLTACVRWAYFREKCQKYTHPPL